MTKLAVTNLFRITISPITQNIVPDWSELSCELADRAWPYRFYIVKFEAVGVWMRNSNLNRLEKPSKLRKQHSTIMVDTYPLIVICQRLESTRSTEILTKHSESLYAVVFISFFPRWGRGVREGRVGGRLVCVHSKQPKHSQNEEENIWICA